MARSLDALDGLFDFLKSRLEGQQVGDRDAFCVKLAAEELFANMVLHNTGRGGPIRFSLEITGEEIRFELVDRDVDPIDPEAWPVADVEQPLESRKPGGLGLHLVRSVADRITYDYGDRQMSVSVVKRRAR